MSFTGDGSEASSSSSHTVVSITMMQWNVISN